MTRWFLSLFLLMTVASAAQTNSDSAPRPYTAGQIRATMPVGFSCHYTENKNGVFSHQHWKVLKADQETVEIRFETTDGDGRSTGEPRVSKFKWLDLRDHATFPAQRTTLRDVTHKVPAGSFECWLYTVKDEKGERRFYFAKEKPGAPIDFGLWVDGEPVERTVLIDYSPR